MRRAGNLWPTIVSFENLCRAAWRAARGKRHVEGIARFLERLEPEVFALQRNLEQETYEPGRAFTFRIFDPKERTITAAPFSDRVVHHALIDPLEPIFERRMASESYACRRGKGTHAALARARQLLRRFEYFLKLDVEHCFESLRHDVVLDTLGRVVKDRNVLRLCERIVRPGGRDGVGLPIGNLTSQWFANLVLDRLDHTIKEVMRIPGYVRYMDDFVLLADDKQRLQEALDEIMVFLANPLRLRLKQCATILAPAREGLPFLGWHIYRGTVRLRRANIQRTRRRLRHRHWEFEVGRIDERKLADCVRSVVAHLEHGTTRAMRRRWFEDARLKIEDYRLRMED
ncbi:MAG: reverse transcriptase/maturase family protein [Planctomycetota bacterium]